MAGSVTSSSAGDSLVILRARSWRGCRGRGSGVAPPTRRAARPGRADWPRRTCGRLLRTEWLLVGVLPGRAALIPFGCRGASRGPTDRPRAQQHRVRPRGVRPSESHQRHPHCLAPQNCSGNDGGMVIGSLAEWVAGLATAATLIYLVVYPRRQRPSSETRIRVDTQAASAPG